MQCYMRMGTCQVIHPITSFCKEGRHNNFDGAYVGGLPSGINIRESPKIGISFEGMPFIRTADGACKRKKAATLLPFLSLQVLVIISQLPLV